MKIRMLTIRAEQLRVLAAVPLQAFEDELVDHCRSFAARLFQMRGEECIRGMVRTGMTHAGNGGFTVRGPVRYWVEMMFAFGHEFHTDPQLQWLATPLAALAEPQLERAKAVFLGMQQYQLQVEGDNKAFALAALRRVLNADWSVIGKGGEEQVDSVMAAMAGLYPEKAACVGTDVLRALAVSADIAAAARGITDAPGRALIAGLMFGFGHGVLSDPMYPWVAATLAGPAEGGARWPRLASKTRRYIEAMLEHLRP